MTMRDQERLEARLRAHDVPGASVAILDGGRVDVFCAGVANVGTGEPVTDDTIFPIGSITKLFTTSLIMQMTEAGSVDLDERVKTYLPDLALPDPVSTDQITVRDLLTHTSGIAGDYLYDPGTGEDAIEQYVRSLATLPILHPPRALFSYSNSAFVLAGYLIERLTGKTWHDVVRTRLIEPLGLTSMVTLPQDAGSSPIITPHRRGPSGRPMVGEMWSEFHAGAPAGFTPYATASDVVAFAAMHLAGGRTREREPLLSEESVALMQEPQVASLPSGAFDAAGWGLGWALHRIGAEPAIGHNGGTSAVLRVLPGESFAIAVLTNVSGGLRLAGDLIRELFGIHAPPYPDLQPAVDAARLRTYEGIYRHLDYTATIEASGEDLVLTIGSAHKGPGEHVALQPVGPDAFMGHFAERGMARVGFIRADGDGRPDYFHMGLRAYRRDA
jgi:CubicO group peptidase (beta-lactamase class C family)